MVTVKAVALPLLQFQRVSLAVAMEEAFWVPCLLEGAWPLVAAAVVMQAKLQPKLQLSCRVQANAADHPLLLRHHLLPAEGGRAVHGLS
mmetsp:Transcript_112383/g.281540  ORF Transcript_112383/g.281540 Transcript_112383/m.281540 type:complete len:89 (-) Transcript_112383:47-313(-)